MRAVFGKDAGGTSRQLRDALCALVRVAVNPLWLLPAMQRNFGPLTPWAKLVRTRRAVESILYAEFARRRAARDESSSDVLRCCWRHGTRTVDRCPTQRSATR